MTHTAPSFTITPNGYDVRIECNVCHDSSAGSLARAWANSHTHTEAEEEGPQS